MAARLLVAGLQRQCSAGKYATITGLRGLSQTPQKMAMIGRDPKKDSELIPAEEKDEISSITGIPEDLIKNRKARIYMPARNLMQSGSFKTRVWHLELDTQERWENPLMGWVSTGDPMSNTVFQFDSKDEAVTYAQHQGFDYEVQQENLERPRPQSYGANYSWNKRTRLSTK